MKKPLVSVIIPFYNEELYLERAVNSVLKQTYEAIEIILVNDGSTDNSQAIAENICSKNKLTKLITIKNKGPGNARNIGIQNTSSDFICFLDADDELKSMAIQKMYVNLITTNSDLVFCMHTMLDKNKKELKNSTWTGLFVMNSYKVISLLINGKLIPTVWGKLFKSAIAKQCTFPNKSWKEDDVFMLQYLNLSNNISIINESLILINCRKNSLTRQTISKKMMEDISFSYKEQYKLIRKYNNKELNTNLLKNQISTFLDLFLIIQIDWNKIKNRDSFLNLFNHESKKLKITSKKHPIGFKKVILLTFIRLPKVIGWKFSFFVIKLFKKNKLKQLKRIKI